MLINLKCKWQYYGLPYCDDELFFSSLTAPTLNTFSCAKYRVYKLFLYMNTNPTNGTIFVNLFTLRTLWGTDYSFPFIKYVPFESTDPFSRSEGI